MHNEILHMKEDLKKKCDQLHLLNEKPLMPINQYFDSIINEIDYEIEASLYESSEEGSSYDFDLDRLQLIADVKQKEYLIQTSLISNEQEKTEKRQKYNTIEGQIEEIFSEENEEQLSLSDFEDHYEKIVLQLLDEKRELERTIMSNQTFIYAPSEDHKDGGRLLHIEGHFLDSIEIECFK